MPLQPDTKQKIEKACQDAILELELMYEDGEPSADAIGMWYRKWFPTATYKYLSRSWMGWLKNRGV